MKLRSFIWKLLPWIISGTALYFVCKDTDWGTLSEHVASANLLWLLGALLLTVASYFIRAYRWIYLFPVRPFGFVDSFKVLILGFFMNNVLPARTGELVRAHVGSQVSKLKRTLVLATVATERLADGLMLSILFIALAIHAGDQRISQNLLYVTSIFGVVAILVILTLVFRRRIFAATQKFADRFNHHRTDYAVNRLRVFINGLAPLFTWSRIPIISFWSLLVWLIELSVYAMVSQAYAVDLTLAQCVLFLVTVNFSSLIPSAPGAIGVIEGVTTYVLVSIGIDKEIALSMVLSQHIIQYLVVGVPGAFVLFNWKGEIKKIEKEEQIEEEDLQATQKLKKPN